MIFLELVKVPGASSSHFGLGLLFENRLRRNNLCVSKRLDYARFVAKRLTPDGITTFICKNLDFLNWGVIIDYRQGCYYRLSSRSPGQLKKDCQKFGISIGGPFFRWLLKNHDSGVAGSQTADPARNVG